MTVKDIIKLVCDFIGESEIFVKLSSGDDLQLSESEKDKVDRMIRCFNLVNQEIASDYLPMLCREKVDASGILSFATLKNKIVHLYEVKNRYGFNLKFKLFSDYAEISGRAKTVLYSFLPENLDLGDEVDGRVQARIYAYGVASEYLLIDGVNEDAEIWESRFKDSLFMLSRKGGEHILPKRKWF